jgi:hypothetical protein
MTTNEPRKPRVFIDADVLFAGAASPSTHRASLVVLRMAEITLIDALTSEQVQGEVERNLQAKMPAALPAFRLLLQRCLKIVPGPSASELNPHRGLADGKDLPIPVAVIREGCPWLVTFNLRDYKPGHPDVTVLRPGDFVREVRYLLGRL